MADIRPLLQINSAECLETETEHGEMAVNVSGLVNNEIVGEFHVTVLEDFLTRKSKIVGKRILRVRYLRIEILKRNSRKAKYCFRYTWIKKCGTTNEAFFFETGPECPLGKGVICCKSIKNKEIYDLIHNRCVQLGRLLRPNSIDELDRLPLAPIPLTPAMELPENHTHIDNMIPDRKSKFSSLQAPSSTEASEIRFDRDHLQHKKNKLPVQDCEQKTNKRADPTYTRNILNDKMFRPLPPLPAIEINDDFDDTQTDEELPYTPVPTRSGRTSPAEQSLNHCMSDPTLMLNDECSILCAGSEASEIQKTYDINETYYTCEATYHNDDAAYDKETYRNDNGTANRDTHCAQDEVHNDHVNYIEDPNQYFDTEWDDNYSDLSKDDSSEDDTEIESVLKNFNECTRSISTLLIKELEHSRSESILKQGQGYRKVTERTIRTNEVLPFLSDLEIDSIKSQITSKTSRGKKDSTKRHQQRHHKRQPGMMSDKTLTTHDAYSIISTGSVTAKIQTTYGTNKTYIRGEGTGNIDNAANDREMLCNDNDNAKEDPHYSQHDVYNDGVNCIEDPNQNHDSLCDEDRNKTQGHAHMKKNSDVDSSDNDCSKDETEVKSLVENYRKSTRSRTYRLTKELEHGQSETILKQVQRYRREIERTIRVNEVLPYLSNLEDKDAISALQKSSPREAVCLMLEQIIASDGEGKWREFVDAVNFAGYSYVANILEGKSTEGMAQDRYDQEKLLQIFTPNIVGNLHPQMLVDHLYAKEVISQTDKEEIECEEKTKGPTAASQMLLDRIPRKVGKWYPEFVSALRESGHCSLADEIDIRKAPCSCDKKQQKNAIDELSEEITDETNEDDDETDVKAQYRRYITPDYKSTSIQEWDLEQEKPGQPLSAFPSPHAPPVPPRIKKNHVTHIASQLSSTNDESNSFLQALMKENRRLSNALRFSRKESYFNVRLQIQENRNGQEVNGNDNVVAVANSETNTSLKETSESTGSHGNVSTRTLTATNPVTGGEPPQEMTTNTPTANGTRSFSSDIQTTGDLSEQCLQQEVPYRPPPPYSCVVTRSVPHQNSERTCLPTNQLMQHPLTFASNSNLMLPQLHPPFFNTFPDQVPVNHLVPPYLFNSIRPVHVNPRPHLHLQETAACQAVAGLTAPHTTFVNQPILLQPIPNVQILRGNTLQEGHSLAGYTPAGNTYPRYPMQQTPTTHMFRNSRSDSGFGSGGLNFYPPNHH